MDILSDFLSFRKTQESEQTVIHRASQFVGTSQDAICHEAKMVQERFEEHKNGFEGFHQISVQTSPIHGGLKGSAANILVPDTSAHVLGSGGVLPGQGCFGSKKENSTILGRGSWRYVWSVYMSKCEHTKRAYLKKKNF